MSRGLVVASALAARHSGHFSGELCVWAGDVSWCLPAVSTSVVMSSMGRCARADSEVRRAGFLNFVCLGQSETCLISG